MTASTSRTHGARLEQLAPTGVSPARGIRLNNVTPSCNPAPDREAQRGCATYSACAARATLPPPRRRRLPELLDADARGARNHNVTDMGRCAIGIGRAASAIYFGAHQRTATKDATALAVPEPGLTQAEVIDAPRRCALLLESRRRPRSAPSTARKFTRRSRTPASIVLQRRMFGGYEFDVLTFYRVIIEVARGCPSSGWCLSLNAAHALQAGAFYSERAQREMCGPPGTSAAQRATPARYRPPGRRGYVSTARGYCSGSPWSTHLMAGAMSRTDRTIEDDQFFGWQLLLTVPRDSWETVDDWGNMIGLRGSGSHSVRVDGRVRPGAPRALAEPVRRRRQRGTPGVPLHGNRCTRGGSSASSAPSWLDRGRRGEGGADEYERLLSTKKTTSPPHVLRARHHDYQRTLGRRWTWSTRLRRRSCASVSSAWSTRGRGLG